MTLIWDGGWNKGEIESINTDNHFSKFTFTAPFEQHSEATELQTHQFHEEDAQVVREAPMQC